MLPIGKLTAKSVNAKVYHKAPQHHPMRGFIGGFADTFLFVVGNQKASVIDQFHIITKVKSCAVNINVNTFLL